MIGGRIDIIKKYKIEQIRISILYTFFYFFVILIFRGFKTVFIINKNKPYRHYKKWSGWAK